MENKYQQNFNAMLRPPMLQQQQQIPQYPEAGIIMHPNASVPWCIQNMPWAQPVNNLVNNVMHFQAPTNFLDENMKRALLHAKRKSDPNPVTVPPPKQFITEEKITAHFNGLHISNFRPDDNSTSVSSMEDDTSLGSSTERSMSFASYEDYRVTAKELEEKLRNANRITLCDDLKKLQEEQKKTVLSTLIPEALINHIEKPPCTALVLYQPPPILELLHRKNDEELRKEAEKAAMDLNKVDVIEDVEFIETDDVDFIDNNNTCTIDYNKCSGDMEEDL